MYRFMINLKKSHVMLATALFVLAAALPSLAFTVPSANSILYSVYNLVIVGLINNGVVYIVGIISIMAGAFFLMQQKIVICLFCIIGGILFLSAGTIATAFGYIC
jgi:uncharacterized membrane protein HdeD (DUF308 family)